MGKSLSKLLNEVYKKIKPTKEQEKKLKSISKKALKLTNKLSRRYKAKAILAGSITRDTWLPEKMEFDIFVLFPESTTRKALEKNGLQVGKSVISRLNGTFEIAYAEHPYVSGNVEGVDIDIVPCYAVKSAEAIKSAVDRTPFHVKYIEKHLKINQSKEVRLLKQFLKSHEIYGADAKTEGISGYVSELLIIYYKNFLNCLKAATKWLPGEVIDVEGFYKKAEYNKLRKEFHGSTLILIDPVDKQRNATAALSAKNFFKFTNAARQFLKEPKEEDFFKKQLQPITEQELAKALEERGTDILVVKFIPPKVVADVLWPQLRRFTERLQSILEETKYEFKVLNKDAFTDEKFMAASVFEMEVDRLPLVQKMFGPPVFDLDDSKRFLEKHANDITYVEENRWVAEVKREFLTAKAKLEDSLKQPLDILLAKGIPNHIAERIVHGFDVLNDKESIMKVVERNADFGIFLRKFFEKEKLTM
jgi:tRNA nucleotidyltransferase (CCA-adding enzyme)